MDGNPDFNFMEHFIRVQQKLAMTRLADFRKKEINVIKLVAVQ
jgi:hypothetical protein